MPTLTIDGRHVDPKDAHERVRAVLDPSRYTTGCPRHSTRNADVGQRCLVTKNLRVNPRYRLDDARKAVLRPEDPPVSGEKHDSPGSNHLLKRPSTLVPLTVRELFVDLEGGMWGTTGGYIVEVSVADRRLLIPRIHRVDGFRELGAAALVDATGVYPDVCIALFPSEDAEVSDFARDTIEDHVGIRFEGIWRPEGLSMCSGKCVEG